MISKFRCESYVGRKKTLAESPCSRCQTLGLKCDQQRPRCEICTRADVACPGYAQKLKWLNSNSYKGKKRSNFSTTDEKETPASEAHIAIKKAASIQAMDISRRKNLSVVPADYLPFIQLFGTKGTSTFLSVKNMPANPFETILRNAIFLNLSTVNPSNCLMDGIAAFSSWQMEYANGDVCSALEYKSKAISGLGSLVKNISAEANEDLLICAAQAIVILTSVDECISSRHNWKIHFNGLNGILQNLSEIDSWSSSLKAVTTWLTWCDLAVAFTSRDLPVIDRKYVIACSRGVTVQKDGWDLFGLSGLCHEQVIILCDIVPLAYLHKKDGGLGIEDFDKLMAIITELPKRLQLDVVTDDIDSDEFTRTCDANVWYIGIILYCYSVFSDTIQPPYKGYEQQMAKILVSWAQKPRKNHPCCKQMILPQFLASMYIEDDEDKEWLREFHARWTKSLSMNLVNDSWSMIQEIWETGKTWMEVLDERQLDGEQVLLG